MLKYIQGLWRLRRIRFNLQACEDIHYLRGSLKLFLMAEGKEVRGWGPEQRVAPLPLARSPIVSRLPQFSEILHERIQEIRAKHDSKLSQERIITWELGLSSTPRPALLSLEKDAFFRNNEAILLTHPKHIPEMDGPEKPVDTPQIFESSK